MNLYAIFIQRAPLRILLPFTQELIFQTKESKSTVHSKSKKKKENDEDNDNDTENGKKSPARIQKHPYFSCMFRLFKLIISRAPGAA